MLQAKGQKSIVIAPGSTKLREAYPQDSVGVGRKLEQEV